jgi:GntR family transcriptional regulator, transcriptional repressor for pyruvate dehydrogenase complex
VNTVPAADGATGRLKEMILSGRLGPGDRLPAERELAAQLGVSRNTIREAVAALTQVGVLDSRVGAGTYVTELRPATLFASTTFAVDLLRSGRILEVLEVRRCLEAHATSRAAGHITVDQLDSLERLMDRMSTESVPIIERIGADFEFHRIIADASGNNILAGLLDSVRGRALPASRWRGATDPTAAERMNVEHRMIYQALVARDADLAATLAAAHVAGVEAWIRDS